MPPLGTQVHEFVQTDMADSVYAAAGVLLVLLASIHYCFMFWLGRLHGPRSHDSSSFVILGHDGCCSSHNVGADQKTGRQLVSGAVI